MADSSSRQGASYLTPEILQYTARLHAPHDAALQAAFAAPDVEGLPAIQVAPSEGKLLQLLLRLCGARRVVEVGTLAGYSAARMAAALPKDGRLWTVELEQRTAEIARRHLEACGFADRVQVCVGAALQVLPTLERHGPFDAVFLDADKESYDVYGRWAAKHVRPGGLLLADNAYFFGKLLEQSRAAEAMRRFHEESREAFDTVCVPTPDGLLMGIRR
jgi:caffeoyl-CoA O-methyltransferase